jgi:signal transduction histidine kinase
MKKINVTVDCDEELIWYFDSMLIKNVLTNVIVNTIRYTKDEIRVAVEKVGDYLRITVEDNGLGFPEELRSDPGGYLTRINFNTGSTGLGLYFSARVAELHRNAEREGYIEVDNESTLGGGAFRIYLP